MEHPQIKNRRKSSLHQKRRRNIIKFFTIIALLVVGALIIYHPIKNLAVSKMIRYETAQWKVLEDSTPEEGVVIREETLIVSPEDGVFEPLVLEGEKVGVGKIIGYVKTQGVTDKVDSIKVPVKAPKAGLVSYHPDGLEDVLKPDLLNKLDIDKISDLLSEKNEHVYIFPKVERGKAVCKIVDNLINPFLYIQGSRNLADKSMDKGQKISIRFSDEISAGAIVRDVKKDEKMSVFMVEILGAPDLSLDNRFVSVNVISDRHEGIVVLSEALVKENGEEGVLVSKKGVCKWVKVEVKGYVGAETVITGLDAGSQYIVNSSLVHQGQRIY